jgi:transcriptional regulator with XRE-family HTH domain
MRRRDHAVDYLPGNGRPRERALTSVAVDVVTARSAGELLRDWRQRRRLTQMDLALDAEISTRHLSFVETGRARPSRDMVLRLAQRLDVPLRERNALLVAAGFAPVFAERPLEDPALGPVREAIRIVLEGQEPFPTLAIDRHWTLVASNRVVPLMLAGVDPELLRPPVNVLRLSMHPGGLAPRIANLPTWRAHLLERLRHQVELTGDPLLVELMREVRDYPAGEPAGGVATAPAVPPGSVVIPLELAGEGGLLRFFSTTTVFGTPVEVTLAELAIESFFPADEATAEAMRRLPLPPR